ncbi:MAG: hypothetical protein QGH75_00795 [Pseudomonadales bacterium]|jgi:hypothetical protein|nr:hypothetical protein [Pseudomonadales bacterium]HJN51690.1 hypothetical protein [Pseudomonadales bacterium]|tara:strand:+ start:6266 stop:8347 length:2082 start_codon:yes stop_codon:yes gene_type:complete
MQEAISGTSLFTNLLNKAVIGLTASLVATLGLAAGDDISGKVSSADGGEAGVWVIAETEELKTGYRKIVVTDDDGRFLIPDLPKATYSVWVRGYGLVDSEKQTSRPGNSVAFNMQLAQTPKEAAQIYPANYWFSLIDIPKPKEFPGTGAEGNGIGTGIQNQAHYINRLKDGCQLCHQLGSKATRELSMVQRDAYATTRIGWENRITLGGNAAWMGRDIRYMGIDHTLDMFSNWTDRIMAGEIPVAPPRPAGVEQNLVITQFGWAQKVGFVHDNVSTDKRDPTINSNGPVYGVGGSFLVVTDPVKNESRQIHVPRNDDGRYSNTHNPMLDDKNRVWMTSSIRTNDNPDWCKDSDHPSVKRFPIQSSSRQMSFYDANKDEMVTYDTCYATHHLQFMDDKNDTLYISGDWNVVGWIDTKEYDKKRDGRAAQGWCPTILDTNGDGKIGEYVEPNEPLDPTKDKRIAGFAYGIITNPIDNSVWFARTYPQVPGQIVRVDPETCFTENYEPPFGTDALPASEWGHGPRGIDIDTNGIIWTALGSSGHIASFDRSKCKVLNGPTATGQHCPEGWAMHRTPGPKLKDVNSNENADFHYLIWVDQFNALGLGENVPIANGTNSDALIAWLPDKQEMVTLRVPYPLNYFTRGLDGRIDDPKGGWKGRGLWASNNSGAIHHSEGGRGSIGYIMQFQLRPDPLAN